MKSFLFFLLICASWAQAQTTTLVSMTGMGEIKLGMKKPEIEKLTGQKIKLVNLLRTGEDWSRDTIKINHKGIDYELMFDRDVAENSNAFIVYEMRSSSALLKTKSGIAIGDDKLKIVSTYPDFLMHISPDYEGADYSVKSKSRSSVWLFGDNSGTVIVFHLANNKVIAFSVMYNEGC